METLFLLQRHRRDRRKLLEFILSAGLIRTPSGDSLDLSDVDLDTISVDYVLECVKSGGVFDPSAANKRYIEALDYPVMINSSSRNFYFLRSKTELSGSPPRRIVPQIKVKISSSHSSCLTEQPDHLVGSETNKSGVESNISDLTAADVHSHPANDAYMPSLNLPTLTTDNFVGCLSKLISSFKILEGLSDDDMRETAYEVLVASFILSRGEVRLFEKKKKEKRSRFLKGLRSKRDELNSRSEPEDCHIDLLDVIRVQMEISEAMDVRTKRGLRHFGEKKMHEQIDVPQISLELLSAISRSDFPTERSYTQWQKRQANILEELLMTSVDFVSDVHAALSMLLSKLRNIEEWVLNTSPDGRAEILTDIKQYASKFSNMPRKFGIRNETYYWTSSFHFNINLYEKLLCSIFDVLEDGQIVEEAEEIIAVLKLTWSTLGIIQKMHNALYAWVLFRQFVRTGEARLLRYAVVEVQKVVSGKDGEGIEEAYMSSLICSVDAYGSTRLLNLVDAVLFDISKWCHNQLEDYHLHFSQDKSAMFESVLTLAILCGSCFADEFAEIKYIIPMAGDGTASILAHSFIEKSIQAAYKRVHNVWDAKAKLEGKHPLTMLADELKLIAEKECTTFLPLLCRQYPDAGILASVLLHQLYGEQLAPFLEGVSQFSESVREVLAAADRLERYLFHIVRSVRNCVGSPIINYLHPYQIQQICAPLILQWLHTQHDIILEWTKRAIQIEDWEPLSSQQRQTTSIIEVFRIIEEIVDQFFNLNLPMDTIHLRSLLIGIVRSLDSYLQYMVNQQVDKRMLYPSPPALTRYKESINPFTKKRSAEHAFIEEKIARQLNDLTVLKLCVKLNTLHYVRDQLDTLEDSVKQSWELAQSGQTFGAAEQDLSISSEPVDELFTIFDDIRRSAVDASDTITDFIGARVIFWDMRDSFLFSLYQGSVESARFEIFIPLLDGVLDYICDLIIDTLRDQVVSSICQASMVLEGYVWVLLDGGPSRVFSDSDVTMMQEDLNVLKDFFIANGQGLPHVIVEKDARLAQQIIDLYSLKASTIIEMLMSASEHVSYYPESKKPGQRCANDAETLLRVLCHKKDEVASRFLKVHYKLPKSSDYEDVLGKEPALKSSLIEDMLKSNTSFNWTEKGQRGFRMMKKKFQEATSEIRHAPW
ncbi:protein unc-13 homolog isoform X3 [Phoenix dactylifera]|uniref:Protein unc-13 homolog isoform X3 n=1 Tax=Phoenix dactylifera TaxID=42345 RepID=A0A8B9AA02_PHODC|nr:protein unc-13 homolog isoform X3 [Phoenix dactylifera]